MKTITVFFARKNKYNSLLKVFEKSFKHIMPQVKLKIIKTKLPPNVDHKRDTAYAFIKAAEYAMKSNSILAIADCDLMFLKSIEEIEKKDFDIAITIRKSSLKYNTGLWFCKPTKKAKSFLKKWIKNTLKLMNNFTAYETFVHNWGGIDQASLHMTLEKSKGVKILELPCEIWNSTQSEWQTINEKTKVVHIKSKLRSYVLNKDLDINDKSIYSSLRPVIKKWREYNDK